MNYTCLEMEERLNNIQKRCVSIIRNLEKCSERSGAYLTNILHHKLSYLGGWIIFNAEALYKQHGGQGHVCVFLTKLEGVAIVWVENEEIVADKSRFATWGSKVLSVKDATDIISNMLDRLDRGDWVPVSEWLERYGKSSGLDFSEYPQA